MNIDELVFSIIARMNLKYMKRFWTDYQDLDMSTVSGYKRRRFSHLLDKQWEY